MKSSNLKYEEAMTRRATSGIVVNQGDTLATAKVRAGIRSTDGRFDEQINLQIEQHQASIEKETKKQQKEQNKIAALEKTEKEAEVPLSGLISPRRPRGKGKKAKLKNV